MNHLKNWIKLGVNFGVKCGVQKGVNPDVILFSSEPMSLSSLKLQHRISLALYEQGRRHDNNPTSISINLDSPQRSRLPFTLYLYSQINLTS